MMNTYLPEGTVTFLFTDIEGSTQLLSQLRDRYAALLADQRSILRDVFANWHGQEVDTQGDAFFVAFPRATQAVCAAVEIQRNLAAHQWPEGVEVRVRMGLHTGEPLKAEEGYVGMDVHRAARIAHIGHGGQVLLSETTAALVKGELPEGVGLLDLGRHRLKDMRDPEHIRQLVIEGLPSEFPPLKSLETLPPAISLDAGSVRLPAFLEEEAVEPTAPPFVGRERELARLDSFLDQALAGEGGVAFITGGPGEGKTALMEAFVRRGLTAHPDLIVASGRCNAYTGVGDPYLPFREVLGDLTGDVEAKWAAGAISLELARRLWGVCPLTARYLIEAGPQLMEVFLSGEGLLSHVSTALPEQRALLQRLKALVDRQRTGPVDVEQKALFAQYTQVLCQLTEAHPLLILLDDLQWADAASLNLLFHLGRCLGGHRILVVGAYRPDEVALGRGEGWHPLESVLNEFKRQFGQVWVDLSDISKTEGYQFLEALVDSQPNHLDSSFRGALFSHTAGHALFTVELLRDLQERGALIKDEAGYWLARPALDWEILPARVDGVIAARIGRL
jgi:class 3 adenylate cyclase